MGQRESGTAHISARKELFYVAGTKTSACYQVASGPHSCLLVVWWMYSQALLTQHHTSCLNTYYCRGSYVCLKRSVGTRTILIQLLVWLLLLLKIIGMTMKHFYNLMHCFHTGLSSFYVWYSWIQLFHMTMRMYMLQLSFFFFPERFSLLMIASCKVSCSCVLVHLPIQHLSIQKFKANSEIFYWVNDRPIFLRTFLGRDYYWISGVYIYVCIYKLLVDLQLLPFICSDKHCRLHAAEKTGNKFLWPGSLLWKFVVEQIVAFWVENACQNQLLTVGIGF